MKATPIPTKSRDLVQRRQHGLCFRCGGPGSEWHHRRSRRVRDEHTHCPCNGVLLCQPCHQWAHANPAAAKASGYVVTQFATIPYGYAVLAPSGEWCSLRCNGDAVCALDSVPQK